MWRKSKNVAIRITERQIDVLANFIADNNYTAALRALANCMGCTKQAEILACIYKIEQIENFVPRDIFNYRKQIKSWLMNEVYRACPKDLADRINCIFR